MTQKEIVEKVRRANDIIDVIGEYFPLKKVGSNYKALCPFHQEKTPSFVVSPDKQLFHCFGCGESGNLYNFVMKMEGLDFPEALRRLAERVNIDIGFQGGKEYTKKKLVRESILKLNFRAAEFYHRVLFSDRGKKALKYLKKRGLNERIIKEFKLGYAPGGDFLTRHALEKGVNRDDMIKACLSDSNRRGELRDKFSGRIIFPIHDERGQVRGFGGRVMDSSRRPKYLNTARTPVFEKKQIIYGLFQGKKSIREKKKIILLEGYMDVIAAHQYGTKEAVAALGTAITPQHIYKIKHWVDDVILALDSDASGMKAAEKGVDLLADSQIKSKVCILPDGSDPEDIIRRDSKEFLHYIENVNCGVNWRIQRSIEKSGGADTADKKVSAVTDLLPLLKSIDNKIRRDEIVKSIAEKLSISESAISQEIKKSTRQRDSLLKRELRFEKLSREEKIFRELLHIALKRRDLKEKISLALKHEFDNKYFKMLKDYIKKSSADVQKAISAAGKGREMLSRLSIMPLNDENPKKYLDELINALDGIASEKKYQRLSEEIKNLYGKNKPQQLRKKNKEFKKLARQLKGCREEVKMNIFKR